MKLRLKYLLLGFTLMFASEAYAQGSAALSCTAPTKLTDGTNLTDLVQYKWYWGTALGSYPNNKTTQASAGCATTITPLAPGPWFFAVSAISTSRGESALSNVSQKTIPQPKPLPPANLVVADDAPIAWAPITTEEALTALAVGTARAGAHCDTTQSFSSPFVAQGAVLYRVPIPDVDLLRGQEGALVAFTKCSAG